MAEGVDGLLRNKTRPPGITPLDAAVVDKVLKLTLEPPCHEATHWTRAGIKRWNQSTRMPLCSSKQRKEPRLVRCVARPEFPKRSLTTGVNHYAGLMSSEMKRLRQLKEENAKLKRIVADLSLDKSMLQDVLQKLCSLPQALVCQ